MGSFPAKSIRSKNGESREDDFYLGIEDKKTFLDYYTIDHGCMDLQIKFLNSVMDGKVKFVKHALNIGSIKKDYEIMRAAIILACRFGQPQVLDSLLHKVHDDFFKAENLNFVAVVVAGISEARKREANQEPSGILDTLIKHARKSLDEGWVNGKIELDWTAFGKYKTTPFMQLCAKKDRCMSSVIKKIVDAEPCLIYLLDVGKVIGGTSCEVGNSALTHAMVSGEQEVIRIILDKMKWDRKSAFEPNMNHIQSVLAKCVHFFSDPHCQNPDVLYFSKREDRMDIIQILIEKCFQTTRENKIGHNNAGFMMDFEKELLVHEHFGAMVYEVIEQERRIAHASGKLTWYDLYDLKLVEGPWTKQGHGPDFRQNREFYGDQLKRYLRSYDNGELILCDQVTVHNEDTGEITKGMEKPMYIDILLSALEKREKCWSCGYQDPELLVCKQCRQARYCDPLCQEEHWGKHQQWCGEQKNKIKLERRDERETRKAKTGRDENYVTWSQMVWGFQMQCLSAHKGEYY